MDSTHEWNQRAAQLRAFFAMDPANVPLACDLFDAYVGAGDIPQAIAFLEGLPAELRAAAAIRFRQARAGLMQGRHAEAVALIQGLIGEGHDSAALWHDLAFAQLCLRDTASARATLQAAMSRFEAPVELIIVAARVAMMDGDFALALRHLEQAESLDATNATVQGLRSLALLDGDETDAAYEVAMGCLAAFPDQHEALMVAGTVALWRQDVPQAEAHFVRALDRLPNSGRCLSGLGQVRMLQNRLDDARAVLLRATAAMPDHIGTWHALAWVELMRGETDEAETSYQRAFDLDRNFADSHGGLALIHALRGRTDDAEAAIRRALRLNPQCPTALYAQTLLLEASGRGDEAMRLLSGLVKPAGLPEGTDLAEFSRRLRGRFGKSPG